VGARDLNRRKFRRKHADNLRSHLILDSKDIYQLPIKSAGPKVRAVTTIDQPDSDANAIAGASYRTLSEVPHPKFMSDVLDINWLAFETTARIVRYYEQPAQPGQRCSQVLYQPIPKIILLRVTAQIRKREHRN
jgi:hypothetical protein